MIIKNELLQGYEKQKILVTGGAGFVGSKVSERLLSLGAEVTILDDLTTGREELIPAGAKFIKASVLDQSLIEQLVGESDYVFHLAARVLASSTKDIRSDGEVNI